MSNYDLASNKPWTGLYWTILILCVPEIVFAVLFYTSNSDIVGILAMLLITAGWVQMPLTCVLLGVLWFQKSLPKRRKFECTVAVSVATAVFARAEWVVMHLKFG